MKLKYSLDEQMEIESIVRTAIDAMRPLDNGAVIDAANRIEVGVRAFLISHALPVAQDAALQSDFE